jgi:hypothetical protein
LEHLAHEQRDAFVAGQHVEDLFGTSLNGLGLNSRS